MNRGAAQSSKPDDFAAPSCAARFLSAQIADRSDAFCRGRLFRHVPLESLYIVHLADDYDDISIQFKLGDKKRTVRLRNLDRLSIIEDIPKEIIQTRNHDRIISYMISTADAYKEYMVWGNRSDI